MPNHCLQLQVPWSFVLLCLCSRTIMKNRQALPLQQPQKPLLTTHERLTCSLGEKEGWGEREGGQKGRGMLFKEEGKGALSRKQAGSPFLTDNANQKRLFKEVTCFTCFAAVVEVKQRLVYIWSMLVFVQSCCLIKELIISASDF